MLRLFINTKVLVLRILVCSIARSSAYGAAWRMFGYMGFSHYLDLYCVVEDHIFGYVIFTFITWFVNELLVICGVWGIYI